MINGSKHVEYKINPEVMEVVWLHPLSYGKGGRRSRKVHSCLLVYMCTISDQVRVWVKWQLLACKLLAWMVLCPVEAGIQRTPT